MIKKLLVVLLLIVAPSLAAAGKSPASQKVDTRTVVKAKSGDTERRLRVARALIKQQDYLNASALLEGLYSENPGDVPTYNLLRQCYFRLKHYEKAEYLALSVIEDDPTVHRFHMDLAEARSLLQNLDGSAEAYQEAMSVCKNDAERLAVLTSMTHYRQSDLALDMIDDLDESVQQRPAFVLQRGRILQIKKLYAVAAGEFVSLLGDTTNIGHNAERTLVSMLENQEASPFVEQVLETSLSKGENTRVHGLLSNHYIKRGSLDRAFELALQQDSLDGFTGNAPHMFLGSTEERGQPHQTKRMAEYLLERYPNRPDELRTRFALARALSRLGDHVAAIENYQAIARRSPRPRDAAEALYQVGKLYSEELDDCSQALIYYDTVVAMQRGASRLNAMRAIPFCLLRLNEFDDAFDEFGRLKGQRGMERGDWPEEFDYFRALIRLSRQEYDSSDVAFRKLMVDYPRGFYVNDALRHIRVFSRIENSEDLKDIYSRSVRYELLRREDSVISCYRQMADHEDVSVADIALWRLAEKHLERGDSAMVLTCVDQLIEKAPESYYLPYGLKTKADLLLDIPGRREEVRDIYRGLLENYPNYPFAPEVRERMREIEQPEQVG